MIWFLCRRFSRTLGFALLASGSMAFAAPVALDNAAQVLGTAPEPLLLGTGQQASGAVHSPQNTAARAATGATSETGPLPESATGALLEDLRQRAGISTPGMAATAASSTSPRAGQSANTARVAEPGIELDPELKETLKSARDWLKETLPGVSGQDVLTPSAGNMAPNDKGLHGASQSTTGQEDGSGATADPSLRRAELAAVQINNTVHSEAPVPGGIPLITELLQSLRDLLLHPVTWLALALALLLRVTLAIVSMRSQRKVRQRFHRKVRAPHETPAGASLLPPASAGSVQGADVRLRRTSRQGQRHRRQQR